MHLTRIEILKLLKKRKNRTEKQWLYWSATDLDMAKAIFTAENFFLDAPFVKGQQLAQINIQIQCKFNTNTSMNTNTNTDNFC